MASRLERILILAKTYPSPSAQHVETSCVAGVTHDGLMRRLYPVPFRLIEEGNQFKKWQWVDVRVEKAVRDHRPESHKLYVDTIVCGALIEPRNGWLDRRPWLDKIPAFPNPEAVDAARVARGVSLALLLPRKIVGLEIVKARNADWSDDEREKLIREQTQGDLFAEADVRRQIAQLRKIPFDFYYRYLCDTPSGSIEHKHKIVDWEVGALYWRCIAEYAEGWKAPFRRKIEDELPSKDLMFLMGNQHRFQDQWLIISLIYPPKLPPDAMLQASLF